MRITQLLFFLLLTGSCLAGGYRTEQLIRGTDTFELLYGDTIIYLMQDQLEQFGSKTRPQGWSLVLRHNGELLDRNSRLIREEGELDIRIESAEPEVIEMLPATFFRPQGYFVVKKEGDADIRAIVGTDTMTICLRAKAVYLEANFGKLLVQEFMGFPAERTKDFVRYGEVREIDGIRYDAGKAIRGMQVEHWKYAEYPGLIVQFHPFNQAYNLMALQAGWQQLSEMVLDTF